MKGQNTILSLVLGAGMMVVSSNALAGLIYTNANPWPVWTPMYWMHEMLKVMENDGRFIDTDGAAAYQAYYQRSYGRSGYPQDYRNPYGYGRTSYNRTQLNPYYRSPYYGNYRSPYYQNSYARNPYTRNGYGAPGYGAPGYGAPGYGRYAPRNYGYYDRNRRAAPVSRYPYNRRPQYSQNNPWDFNRYRGDTIRANPWNNINPAQNWNSYAGINPLGGTSNPMTSWNPVNSFNPMNSVNPMNSLNPAQAWNPGNAFNPMNSMNPTQSFNPLNSTNPMESLSPWGSSTGGNNGLKMPWGNLTPSSYTSQKGSSSRYSSSYIPAKLLRQVQISQ